MLIHDRSIHQFESNWDISELFWSTSQRTTWQLVNNKNQTSHTWLATLTVLIAKASFEQQWLYIPSHFRFGLRHFTREHIVLSLPSSSKKVSLPESYIHFTTTGPTSKQSWVDWCFNWPKPFLESTGIDHLGVKSSLPVHPWWKAYDVIIFDMQFAWKKKGHLLSISLLVGFSNVIRMKGSLLHMTVAVTLRPPHPLCGIMTFSGTWEQVKTKCG